MPSNPYFRNPGHFWYGFTSLKQSLHQFISQYLPVGIFLPTAKWFDIFLLSLSHGLSRGLHLPSMVFSPHLSCDLEIWHLSLVALPSPIQAAVFVLEACGAVNCSDQEVARGWCFPHWLAETQGGNSGASFLWVQEVHAEEWRLWGQCPICTGQSHLNVFCFMWTAMPLHFVALFQGTITWSLCCRASGLAHPFFQLGSERAPASCLMVLQK